MQNKKNKKAQQLMGMPFTMIFAIILIIVFLFVGIWAIKHFMGTKNQIVLLQAVKDVRDNVDGLWGMHEGSSKTITLMLPNAQLCFCNVSGSGCPPRGYTKPNGKGIYAFVIPREIAYDYGIDGYWKIEHADSGEFCIKNKDKLRLKNVGSFVEISKVV